MSVKCIRIQKCGGSRWGTLPRANQRSTGALVAAAPPPCSNPCYQRKSTPLGCFSCQSGKDASLKACGIRRGILPRANQRSTGALVTASPPPCSNPCYQRKSTPLGCFFFGDPYGIRTHVTAVKGRCLNPLTNGPGSGNLTRTDDTPGMNRMLYQLSYAAMCFNSKIDYTR